MLAALLVVGTAIYLALFGYKFYGGLIERKLVSPNKEAKTPAYRHQDDPDYSPAKSPILFGHHFASIAGAGPIIGPIVALAHFGWVAVLGWILVGSVFVGAVHDYLTLMISCRTDGDSIAQVAGNAMGAKAKAVFGAFIFITLVLVISVFGVTGAMTLVSSPSMVIPAFMVIFIAVLFGLAVYKFYIPVIPATIIAVALNIIFLIVGYYVPVDVTAIGLSKAEAQVFWFIILMIYAGVASILPVEILLQPRDYISTFNLYGALGLGIAGLVFVHPEINAPAFMPFNSAKGPMWPMLFVLVACGAVSGFHSLVSGGTTSKQLECETDGKLIGFGGMLLEGLLAMMTLLLVATAFSWGDPEDGLVSSTNLIFFTDAYKDGWIVVFGKGFGKIVSEMLPFIGFGIATLIGMITINTFILTTLDSATRITRFIVQETLGKRFSFFSSKIIALMVCLAPAFLLGITNSWKTIWPMFGASNQLVAALALFVVSAYLIGVKKPTIYTLIPGIFMLLTTVAALIWQAQGFFFGKSVNYTLGITSIILMVLAVFVAYEGFFALYHKRKSSN